MHSSSRALLFLTLLGCSTGQPPAQRTSASPDNASTALIPTAGAGTRARVQAPNPALTETSPPSTALSPDEVAALQRGGPTGSTRLLYPYEGTVFPRGLLPPTLMWSAADSADAAYLRIYASNFDYSAALAPEVDAATQMPSLQVPKAAWAQACERTGGKREPFTLELTLRAGGQIIGPLSLHFVIAQATVQGSIYYNSYASKLPGAALGGNVLRIPPGGEAELFTSMQCNGCHAVSADGSKMLSQIELTTGGNVYDIVPGAPANPSGSPAGERVSFAALYPDGSKYLSTTVALDVAHAQTAQPSEAPAAAALYDAVTGQAVPDTGIPETVAMPMFSPNGRLLVFTDAAVDHGDALAVMDYDTQDHKATAYRLLMRDDQSTRPGWPFFLPDDNAVVFVRTESADFSGNGAYIGAGMFAAFAGAFATLATAPFPGPRSDLFITDLATGSVTLLARAMGFATPEDAATERTTLPFADDTHQSYFPTVAPVAAGGYFWVFFDGIRHYGNRGAMRQLWGFAIDIRADGAYNLDPSHPAFYLPGQEFGTGNHRAFAALDPCRPNGSSCSSGVDCCTGACRMDPDAATPVGSCEPPTGSCATRDERCGTDSDCCPSAAGEPADSCIAGFCAYVPLD